MRNIIKRGIFVSSTNAYTTHNILVPKKKKLDGSTGVITVTLDFRDPKLVTKDVEYYKKYIKYVVRWLTAKKESLVVY